VVDDVAAERPVDLQWRFHVEGDAKLDLGDGGFTSLLDGARTWLRLAQPAGARFGEETDDWNRAVVISPGEKRTRAKLTAVVIPSLPEDASPVIEAPSDRAFVVEALGARVLAAFDGREIPGRLSTDGAAAIVSQTHDTSAFFVAHATHVSASGEPLLSASTPVTASYGHGLLTVTAQKPARMMLRGGITIDVPAGTSTHHVG
jgi:hypothetical protein